MHNERSLVSLQIQNDESRKKQVEFQESTFDVIVIGSGPGGYVAAIRLGQLGKKTALIERDKIGGVCLNVGCIPSKALISASKLMKSAREAQKMGIEGQLTVNLPKLQGWKQSVVDRLTSGVEFLCKESGVNIIHGNATLVSTNQVEVKNGDERKTIRFNDAIIATGTSPIELPLVRFDGKRVISSTESLSLLEPPKTLTIIGGGVIGLEIGMAYSNLFGTKLVIIELLDQLLPGTDMELVNVLYRSLQKIGAEIHTKSRVISGKS